MRTLTAKAPAKINLAIDVLSKRPDGYHDVAMIMQTVDLYDVITVKEDFNQEITISSDTAKIPNNQTNIVYKTAELIKLKYNVKRGVVISIQKNIPVAAGLAGGSTDAAATINLLDDLWKLKLTRAEKMDLGRRIGSDVPFCIMGGTALAEGLGEKLTALPSLPECYILLAKPEMGVSTKEVYEQIDFQEILERPDLKAMIDGIAAGNIKTVADHLCNVLEAVTVKRCPQVEELKQLMREEGALGAMMSGSGPTVFGLFDNQISALLAYDKVRTVVGEVFLVKTTKKA